MKQGNSTIKWPLVGNGHVIDFLTKSIEKNSLSGTYIFYGPDNLGKTTIANIFAQVLLCQGKRNEKKPCEICSSCKKFNIKEESDFSGVHSDLHIVKKEKDKKNISISQIREFIRKLTMSSFLNSYKIGIIKHSQSLSTEAANALLKTLEEPKENVIIILITQDLDSMPSTIVSRSQILKFNPVKSEIIYDYLVKEKGVLRSKAKDFSLLSLGRPALAVKFLEDKDFYNNYLERVNVFLNFFNEDINERFLKIEELIGKKNLNRETSQNKENVKLTSWIIETWLGLIRDLIFIEYNKKELVQHEVVINELSKIKSNLNINKLLYLSDVLKQSNEYIESNVNPKLVLEKIAISI